MECLPHGRPLFRALPYLFAALSLFEMAIHAVGGDSLQRWYLFSENFAAIGDRLPVIHQLPAVMQSHGAGARVDIVLNVVLWNWLLSGSVAVVCLVVIIGNYLRAWREISAAVYAVLRTADRDSALMAFLSFGLTVAVAATMATSLGYGPPFVQYRSDAQFLFIGFIFYAMITMLNAFVILCFAMRFADDSWLKKPFRL